MSRPTPETDAARHDLSDYGSPVLCSWGDWVEADFARKLERERDEARELVYAWESRWKAEVEFAANALKERDEWKNKAYSHATDYTLMEAKCFRLEQQLKEYDKLKS